MGLDINQSKYNIEKKKKQGKYLTNLLSCQKEWGVGDLGIWGVDYPTTRLPNSPSCACCKFYRT